MRKSVKNCFTQKGLFLCLAVMLACWLATVPCAKNAYAQEAAKRLTLIATVFPAYDFARQVVGDTADVQLLLPPGSESHSYEPTPQDIIAIQNADLFLCVGGESEHWVEEIISSLGNKAPRIFRMMDCVSTVAEEQSYSMKPTHEHEEGEHAETDAAPGLDEHVWTSPKNVMLIVKNLAQTLITLAPEDAKLYTTNLRTYQTELQALDAAFIETAQSGKRDLIIFGDRFPLRYFADAYGLRYDAAFPGCSEDSEPSVKTVMSLVDEVRAQQIPVVFYIEFSSRKTADILAEETGAQERLFHSCHSVSAEEMANGATYLGLMWKNQEVLKEALN